MSDASPGLLDTNLFVHAHTNDDATEECQAFLAALEQGRVRAHLDPLVLHELSYALPRYVRQLTREGVARYLLMVLGWPGVLGEKGLMVEAVERWQSAPEIGFVDAYLAALATQHRCPVFTKNVKHLSGQGVVAPQPLPESTSTHPTD